ncbi:MAG: hypothetical protein HY553_17110 [Elusimicrobia bacterium]|nr:hypothetical protein [Elusimicrobiota bacterium]
MPDASGGRLESSGAFRIDRAAALAKLARYQLADPWHCARAWLRAAVLLQSKHIALWSEEKTTRIWFAGVSFPEAVVRDPCFRSFEEEAGTGDAARHLAVGLLGCQRLQPDRLVLSSGRLAWSCDEAGIERVAERRPGEGEYSTELIVEWTLAENAARFEKEVRLSSALLATRLRINGETIGHRPEDRQSRPRRVLGRRVTVCSEAANAEGEIDLCRDGVLVEVHRHKPLEGLAVAVNDDAFTLDLGCSSVVKDERFRDTLALVEREAKRVPAGDRVEGPVLRVLTLLQAVVVGAFGISCGWVLADSGGWLSFLGVCVLLFTAVIALVGIAGATRRLRGRFGWKFRFLDY